MAKMNDRQWQLAREAWEADPREGYTWLARELELPVSVPAVRKTALKQGWSKRQEPQGATGSVTTELPEVSPGVTSENPGAGRPSDYRPEFAGIAFNLMLLGFTRKKLAQVFGVDERTVYRWQQDYPEFCQALCRGGAQADGEVAEALFNRAKGAVVPDVHIALHEGRPVITPTAKHYPPDVGAARLWLKNRQPELWKEKVEVIEKPTIALVDKEAMSDMYKRIMAEADETRKRMQSRKERLGLLLDSERGGAIAVRDDDVVIDDRIEGQS